MWHEVLIIEDESAESITGLAKALQTADVAVNRRSVWSSFSPGHLAVCTENMVVVNAVPANENVRRFFNWLHEHPLHVPTLAILPSDDVEMIRIAAAVVDDFLFWPVNQEELRHRILRVLGPRSQNASEVQRALVGQIGLDKLVGNSPAFLNALSRVSLLGSSDAPVLLTGETGTGKELFARVIHLFSRR